MRTDHSDVSETDPHRSQRLRADRAQHRLAARPGMASVGSAIAILRLLAASDRPMGVNAIARAIRRTPSSCFNILKTLLAEGFIECDGDSKAYTLGRGMVAIARRALDPNATFGWMRENMERLADDWSVTTALWRVRSRSHVVLVGYAAGAASTRIHLSVGEKLPLLSGAIGQCIAAFGGLSNDDIARELARPSWEQPPTLPEYLEEIERTRRRAWGLDEGRLHRGLTSVAAPIADSSREVCYCLAATMFAGRLAPGALRDLAAQMLETTAWAARELAHMNDSSPFRQDQAAASEQS